MTDLFDNTILCAKCGKKMEKVTLSKNGFLLRAVICPKCNQKQIHPEDEAKYANFINLKNKEFRVKMRLVGNSYAISIPKEIVSFIKEQERILDDIVSLGFTEADRLFLDFGSLHNKIHRQVQGNAFKEKNNLELNKDIHKEAVHEGGKK